VFHRCVIDRGAMLPGFFIPSTGSALSCATSPCYDLSMPSKTSPNSLLQEMESGMKGFGIYVSFL
jgi:hypothetical protein